VAETLQEQQRQKPFFLFLLWAASDSHHHLPQLLSIFLSLYVMAKRQLPLGLFFAICGLGKNGNTKSVMK
jgi:hypothetical protein